jgi:hypothetical protein
MRNYIFNYDKFYNFYTNQKNLIINKDDSVVLNFFNKTTKKGVKLPKICEPKQTDERYQYIIINGYKIYIADYSKTGRAENQKDDSKELLFSIPTEINGKLYDFHYHFGISFDTNSQENKIFFHKTEQCLSCSENTIDKPYDGKGFYKHIDCYFLDNIPIKNIRTIICENEKSFTLETAIKNEIDLKILEKLMSRPFVISGGKSIRKRQKIVKTHKKLKKPRFS